MVAKPSRQVSQERYIDGRPLVCNDAQSQKEDDRNVADYDGDDDDDDDDKNDDDQDDDDQDADSCRLMPFTTSTLFGVAPFVLWSGRQSKCVLPSN
eukprot:4165675-Amphidinium_carterae.1